MSKGTYITFITLEVLAGLIGLVSGYGSSCPTINPTGVDSAGDPYIYQIIIDFQWLWYITTTLTLLVGIVSFVLVYALINRKSWFYNVALITSFVGFITGAIPYYLIITNTDGGTPSYMRMYLNLLILVLLLIPAIKKGIEKRSGMSEEEIKEEGSSKTETASVMSFSIGIATIVTGFVVSITHDINGTQYFPYLVATFYVGLFLILSGVGLLILSKLLPSGNTTRFELPAK